MLRCKYKYKYSCDIRNHLIYITFNVEFAINCNIDMYDRIVIATPTWWDTMAPAILTLLSNINLEGKEVVLVQTHAGWPGSCLEDMEKLCKGANIISKKDIQFDSNGGPEMITPIENLNTWISSL